MLLEQITINNFLSIRSVTLKLSNRGLVLIQGENLDDPAYDSNGAGKSTIFEALTYLLFDKTTRELKGNDVVNDNIGKNCVVQLDFKDDNGVPYRISRYRKHKEHKNNVYIFRDGKNITPKSNKDSNKFIEQLFSIDYETFTNSILFGQGLVKMFSVASDSDKKAILEKMLNITVFKNAQDEAKSRLSDKKNEIDKIDGDKIKTENLIEEVKETIDRLEVMEKEHAKNTQKEIDSLYKELDEVEEQLANESKDNSEYDERKINAEKLREVVDEKLSKFKQYENSRNELSVELQSMLREKKRIDRDIDELKSEYEKIKAGKGTNCPACGQEITEDTTEQSLKHVKDKLAEKLIERESTLKSLGELKSDLEKIDEYLKGKEKLETQKEVIQRELSEISALISTRERIIDELSNRADNLKNSIERLQDQLEKTYKPMIDEKKVQLVELEGTLKELVQERSELVKEVDLIEFWVKGFGNSGIKSYLLDSVTPFLNKRANYYLSKLAGNTVEVEFSTQTRLKNGEVRDKFEIRINNLVGGPSYKANSTGEKRRIDLAISLALQDLVMSRANGKMNILLYDEAFDGLDAVGCENVIQLLEEMQGNVDSIFVITHNDHLKPFFDKSITVTKENGETTITRED